MSLSPSPHPAGVTHEGKQSKYRHFNKNNFLRVSVTPCGEGVGGYQAAHSFFGINKLFENNSFFEVN